MIIKPKLTLVVVPNVELIAREMTDTSQIGIMVRRLRKLESRALIKLVLNNVKFTLKVLRKDFATGIKILTELEILNQMKRQQSHFVLHNQMVDMAIALNNRRLLMYFFGLARTYHFLPGLKTYNPERLVMMLADTQGVPSNLLIYTPIQQKSPLEEYAQYSPILFVRQKKEA